MLVVMVEVMMIDDDDGYDDDDGGGDGDSDSDNSSALKLSGYAMFILVAYHIQEAFHICFTTL